ncbi:hypothetical protein, partial [Oceanobacter antarcticus]
PETATLQERYHSILQNCRRLNGINVLLKRSILDNWVENYRYLCSEYRCWRCSENHRICRMIQGSWVWDLVNRTVVF